MTTNTARQPKGIPVGGQFAATAHPESDVNLTPARRAELEGWPAGLPDPEVSVNIDDSGQVSTSVKIDGSDAFELRNPADDIHDIEIDAFVNKWTEDDSVHEAAEKWAHAAHDKIAFPVRAEMRAAAERVRADILAKATGQRTQLSSSELDAFRNKCIEAANRANRDLEYASTAMAARDILEQHPTAAFADLRVDSWDNGEFVSGAIVRDAAGNQLYDYSETPGETDEHDRDNYVVDALRCLDANAEQSHWASAFSVGGYGDELYTIDLQKAAAWNPGYEA